MDKYRYSVIIPHYNDVNALRTCVKTIPDREDIQVIIVDDNTFDDNNRIKKELSDTVNSYVNTAIEIYVNDSVRSAGACRNIGLDHAKGKWLIFADADDWFLDTAFDTFDIHSDDGEDIIYFASTSVELPDMTPGVRHIHYVEAIRRYLKNRNDEAYLKYQFVVPWAKMVRFKLVEENNIRFDEVRWCNDVMFSVRTGFYARSIAAFTDPVYCITRKKGTLTSKRSEQEFLTRFDVYVSEYVFLYPKLNKKDFKDATGATGVWIVRAISEKHGLSAIRYILHAYRVNGIKLAFPVTNSVKYVFSWLKTGRHDKKYNAE